MNPDAEEGGLVPGSFDDKPGSSVEVSRERATGRVLWGGGLTTLGGVLFGIGTSVSNLPFGLMIGSVIGGLSLAGIGLVVLGSAATHLYRFGRARPTLILGAGAGLGFSVGLGSLLLVCPLFLGHSSIFGRLVGYSAVSVFGLSAFIVLLVLGAVMRWMFGLKRDDTVFTHSGT